MSSTSRTISGILAQVNLSTTGATSIYTVPSLASRGVLNLTIYIANRTSSAVAVRLNLTKSGNSDDQTTDYLGYGFSVPGNNAPLPVYLPGLGPGDEIRALAGSSNAITITVLGEERAS